MKNEIFILLIVLSSVILFNQAFLGIQHSFSAVMIENVAGCAVPMHDDCNEDVLIINNTKVFHLTQEKYITCHYSQDIVNKSPDVWRPPD